MNREPGTSHLAANNDTTSSGDEAKKIEADNNAADNNAENNNAANGDGPGFVETVNCVSALLQRHVTASRRQAGKVLDLKPLSVNQESLRLDRFLEQAGGNGDPSLLPEFLDRYLDSLIRLHDPRFLGHQVARPHFASAVAELVNGMTNNGMGVYEMGPGAVTIERFVVHWLLQCLPQPAWGDADGVLTHGGSLANLTAILAARGKFDPASWEDSVSPDHVFLIPDSSHYSIKRAICIAGYGENSIAYLPTDDVGRIRPECINEVVQSVKTKGRRPAFISANAGSTPVGLYDDLESIGQIAKAHDLWFHVDGAHGASALVSDRQRDLLKGIEYADSLVWDQHKLLQTSALCTALLLRDGKSFSGLFQQHAPYLSDGSLDEYPNLYERAVECTKVPMGLKFYLCLLACGPQGLARFVDQLFDRTHEFHRLIESRPRFSSPCSPQSNILCFEYDHPADPFAVRDRIVQQGDFYLTRTELKGRKFFRFTVTSPETDADIVLGILDRIESVSDELI